MNVKVIPNSATEKGSLQLWINSYVNLLMVLYGIFTDLVTKLLLCSSESKETYCTCKITKDVT